MPERSKRKALLWAATTGGILVAAVGAGFLLLPAGEGIRHLSYDLPFRLLRPDPPIPDELVMVYIDQNVKANLGAPLDQPLARAYHARLLERLKQDGPKVIFYDIIFDTPSENPDVDKQFAEAIRNEGAVVLVGYFEEEVPGNALAKVVHPPTSLLKENCAGWGLAEIPRDPDQAARRIFPGSETVPSATWIAARFVGASCTRDERERFRTRWLNYYGPPSSFRSVNFDQALDPKGVPPGYFKNKIVVVGSPPSVGLAGAAREDLATPYSRFGWPFSSLPQIQAQTLLNLVRGDWLEPISPPCQLIAAILCGLALGTGLMFVRPWNAAWLALLASVLVGALSAWVQLRFQLWWAWLVPAAIQTPSALVWSVGWHYALESRRRKKLRQAFAGYLSPYMADRIADEDFDVSLGGKVVEATVMFTDLDGFTAMSENLDPVEVSKILTTYFNQTTRGILEEEGTIIKYMGDAVLAVWGAPLPEPRHAERAVRAAWIMTQASQTQIAGRTLRTRIGINSGLVLAGNLGSDFRFDYAAIGDTTNLASRLEGLNKYLGTNLLISEATQQQIRFPIQTRILGRFLLAGKSQPVSAHEVLALESDSTPEWLTVFDQALEQFKTRNLKQAEGLLRQVIELRGGSDGPSSFYLKQIAVACQDGSTHRDWDGIIRLSDK